MCLHVVCVRKCVCTYVCVNPSVHRFRLTTKASTQEAKNPFSVTFDLRQEQVLVSVSSRFDFSLKKTDGGRRKKIG